MKPRDVVYSVFDTSTPSLEQLVEDMRIELYQTREQLKEARRAKALAELHLAAYKSESNKPPVIPIGDIDYGYECPNPHCYARLVEDYKYCPGCGSEIDWDGWSVPQPDEENDAYDRYFDR